MTTILRQPFLAVNVNLMPLADVISARVQLGYSLRVAQAEIEVRELPVGLDVWDVVEVAMGATEATVEVRFTGVFVSHETQFYPKSVKLICRGMLQRAENYEADNEVDMSSRGEGHHDETMVATILYICGIIGPITGETVPAEIAGTGRLLGKYSWERGFAWRSGETGLSFIERLDAVSLGYRTYDTADGTIVRSLISTAPVMLVDFSFTEGVDIFRASASDEVLSTRNRIVAEGFPGWDGKDKITHTEQAANSYLLDAFGWQRYQTHKVSSAMIEKELTAGTRTGAYPLDAADGLSCEAVATWLLAEMKERTIKVTMTTPRDDLIAPGSTIAVTSPLRLGVTQGFWVQQIDTQITTANQFSQILTCYGTHALPS